MRSNKNFMINKLAASEQPGREQLEATINSVYKNREFINGEMKEAFSKLEGFFGEDSEIFEAINSPQLKESIDLAKSKFDEIKSNIAEAAEAGKDGMSEFLMEIKNVSSGAVSVSQVTQLALEIKGSIPLDVGVEVDQALGLSSVDATIKRLSELYNNKGVEVLKVKIDFGEGEVEAIPSQINHRAKLVTHNGKDYRFDDLITMIIDIKPKGSYSSEKRIGLHWNGDYQLFFDMSSGIGKGYALDVGTRAFISIFYNPVLGNVDIKENKTGGSRRLNLVKEAEGVEQEKDDESIAMANLSFIAGVSSELQDVSEDDMSKAMQGMLIKGDDLGDLMSIIDNVDDMTIVFSLMQSAIGVYTIATGAVSNLEDTFSQIKEIALSLEANVKTLKEPRVKTTINSLIAIAISFAVASLILNFSDGGLEIGGGGADAFIKLLYSGDGAIASAFISLIAIISFNSYTERGPIFESINSITRGGLESVVDGAKDFFADRKLEKTEKSSNAKSSKIMEFIKAYSGFDKAVFVFKLFGFIFVAAAIFGALWWAKSGELSNRSFYPGYSYGQLLGEGWTDLLPLLFVGGATVVMEAVGLQALTTIAAQSYNILPQVRKSKNLRKLFNRSKKKNKSNDSRLEGLSDEILKFNKMCLITFPGIKRLLKSLRDNNKDIKEISEILSTLPPGSFPYEGELYTLDDILREEHQSLRKDSSKLHNRGIIKHSVLNKIAILTMFLEKNNYTEVKIIRNIV